MFTWRQMMIATPSKILQNANSVTLSLKSKSSKNVYDEFLFKVQGSEKVYDLILRLYPNNGLWVHCDCDWFRYNSEYALALKGSSNIISSDGTAPLETNPTLKPMICKHTVKAIVFLQNKRLI